MDGLVLNITYGSELEFADVKYGQHLPEGNSWNKQDYSIVNSNGVANCPVGKYYEFGGEINTKPTNSISDQCENFEEILTALNPIAVVNYRCNLHIHVGLRGLKDDLTALKKLLSYIDIWQQTIFKITENVPKPTIQEYSDAASFQGAMKRYRRRFKSHQSVLTPQQVSVMLRSSTTKEFYLAHFVNDKQGKPQKQLHQRCGINLRSLWENDETIEFRHFPGTVDSTEFRSAVTWCSLFMEAALETSVSPNVILENNQWLKFPEFKPYNHNLELGYVQTCHDIPTPIRIQNIERIVRETAPVTS